MYNLDNIGPSTYLLPKEDGMRVPGLLIASEELLQDKEVEQSLNQVRNVAHLPGIVGHSIAMPDIHWGYGFPIGGVAAMDVDTGVISPGGVGYDINCGVRMAVIPEEWKNIDAKAKRKLLERIFQIVPCGVGKKVKGASLSDSDYRKVVEEGAVWSIKNGFGFEEDLEHIESRGVIENADMDAVSKHAKDRGKGQLGTLGSGNHFIEMGVIQDIFLPDAAHSWGY